MILMRRVRAGILLYALLMSSIFLLLLQVYLHQVDYYKREYVIQMENSKVFLMAELVRQSISDRKGQQEFDGGTVRYDIKGNILKMDISLASGKQYQMKYPILEENKRNEKPQVKGTR